MISVIRMVLASVIFGLLLLAVAPLVIILVLACIIYESFAHGSTCYAHSSR